MRVFALAGLFFTLVGEPTVGAAGEPFRSARLPTPPVAATAKVSKIKSVTTRGEVHHLHLDGDTLAFCDERGAWAVDLRTSRNFARVDVCPPPEEPNAACSQIGIDAEVRTPLSIPDDVLDIGEAPIPLKGRVHDCAVSGTLMAIITGSTVNLVDVASNKLTTIDHVGGERIVAGGNWIAWSANGAIRWIEIMGRTGTRR